MRVIKTLEIFFPGSETVAGINNQADCLAETVQRLYFGGS